MSNQQVMLKPLALALVLALVSLVPGVVSAQSSGVRPVQSAAKSSRNSELPATGSRMAATRQDKAAIAAAIDSSNALLGRASPAVKVWVQDEARRQALGEPSASAAETAARERFGGDLAGADIDAIVQLVMFEIAQQAEQELRDEMAQMRAANQQKRVQREAAQKMRKDQAALQHASHAEYVEAVPTLSRTDLDADVTSDKDQLDSMSDLAEMDQLRLQRLMERRQKAFEVLSNIVKKTSETQETIIGNLK